MKRIKTPTHIVCHLLPMLVALLLTSCTHNNGDIGPLFGDWTLEQYQVDGESQPIPDQGSVWSFQGDIVRITRVYAHHEVGIVYGTWTLTEDGGVSTLTLDFDHATAQGSADCQHPWWLSMGLVNELRVEWHGHSKMVLSGTGADGHAVCYTLSKQW